MSKMDCRNKPHKQQCYTAVIQYDVVNTLFKDTPQAGTGNNYLTGNRTVVILFTSREVLELSEQSKIHLPQGG